MEKANTNNKELTFFNGNKIWSNRHFVRARRKEEMEKDKFVFHFKCFKHK